MAQILFHNAKLKVERANKHIRDFNEVMNAFLKTDFCRLTIEKNVDSAENILRFERLTNIPDDGITILGDAIHNLRSALDLLMWDLIESCGGTPDKSIYFPITKTRKELIKALRNRKVKTIGASIITLILDGIKPYDGGNNSLFTLHNLDNLDKHRFVIPTITVVGLSGVSCRVGTNRFINISITVGKHGKLNLIGSPFEIEMENKGNPSFDVVFGEGQFFEGELVVPTLYQLSQTVFGVTEQIEKAYLARI